VESFNGRLRDECLNETLFASLSHARTHARSVLRAWRDDYNHGRPHSGIGGLAPADAPGGLRPPALMGTISDLLPVSWTILSWKIPVWD
jgi:putative transposase